ncbi:linear amide C-N hydrolase [Achromobacter sp. K91]|uniref:linear amide C-N hydrolase n=1 Tax=Achromobacter sp. K91 TaxID=2292262 RepID=UPI0018F7A56C|nr:choloylglycine hydrolase family protein [Achromobacter sp. K91]
MSVKKIAMSGRLKCRIGRLFVVWTAAATLLLGQTAWACTSFTIKATDGSVIYGRTMEFGLEMESRVMFIPRAHLLEAAAPPGRKGMTWQSKYAVVGMNAFGLTSIIDGVNEKGLAGGVLYFPGYAQYADPASVSAEKSLAPWDLLTWALTRFATVAEVKAALSQVAVVNIKQEAMGGLIPPLHYTLHDRSGASIVIEPINGELRLHDNPMGVLTNSPPFEWHMINLGNYVKLSATEAPALRIEGQTIAPSGQGSGLLGVPGDPTPPSRFVRAIGYSISASRQAPGLPSVKLAEHIANSFDIPKGWIKPTGQHAELMDYTQWTTVIDLSNLRYYVKSYDDQTLRLVDLKSFDLDAKAVSSAALSTGAEPATGLAFKTQAAH